MLGSETVYVRKPQHRKAPSVPAPDFVLRVAGAAFF